MLPIPRMHRAHLEAAIIGWVLTGSAIAAGQQSAPATSSVAPAASLDPVAEVPPQAQDITPPSEGEPARDPLPWLKKGPHVRKKKAKKQQSAPSEADSEIALGDPWGDGDPGLRIAGLDFRILAQTQYEHTFPSGSTSTRPRYRVVEESLVQAQDGWDLNRMFFRMMAEPSRYLALKVVADFSEFRHNNPKQALKQAHVELRPIPKHLHLVVGVMKVPFDILELDAISKFEFGTFGQTNALLNDLAFAGRDTGAELVFAPLSKPRFFNVVAGAYRGHANSESASPVGVLAIRAESELLKGYRVGAGFVAHPQRSDQFESFDLSNKALLANPADPGRPRERTWDSGSAVGADMTYNRGGVMLRSEGMTGSRIDYDTRYGAKRWAALWAIASYTWPRSGWFKLQPALRAELLDTDLQHDAGFRQQYSFSISTHLGPGVRAMLDVTRTQVQANSPVVDQPDPLREAPYLDLSHTRVIAQLQVVL